jgi:hypothetical protein
MNRSQWVEIVGIVAVVLSLIFVGLELRQNTAALSAQPLADLNLAANADFHLAAENVDLAGLNVRGREGIEGFSAIELERYRSSWYSTFNTYEAAFPFHQKAIISDRDYETWRRGACDSYQSPGVKYLLDTGELSINSDFKSALDKCGNP